MTTVRDVRRADAAHLLRRTSFVVSPSRIDELAELSREDAVTAVVADKGTDLEAPDQPVDGEITPWWVERMVAPTSGVHEWMTWFWHTKLPTHVEKITFQPLIPRQLTALRNHALSSVGAMLQAFVADGALMQYLDLSGSRPPTPNENLARELMELFTVGEGHYSEEDVRQAALAMTGWSVGLTTGDIRFDANDAHGGPVTFLGERGQWDLSSIVDRLVDHPATAARWASAVHEHLTGRALDPSAADELGRWWAARDLAMPELLGRILLDDAFWQHRLDRPRSPVEYYCAVRSVVGHGESVTWQLFELGQVPFRPPNVGGWPSVDAWSTPAALLPRLFMVQVLDFADPVDSTTDNVDGLLNRCGMHELSEPTLAALNEVETDGSLRNERQVRQARLRVILTAPEFQLS